MQVEAVNILQFIFVFLAGFGAILIYPNARYRGLFYMAIFLAVAMSFNLLEELNITRQIYLVTPIFTLAKGPVFYLFVYRLVYPDRPFTYFQLSHFLPMLITLPLTSWPQMVIAFGTVSQIIYAGLVVHLIYQYHIASASMRSDAESLQLKWVLKVLVAYILLGLYDLIRLNMQPYIPYSVNLGGQFFGTLCGLVIFAFLIYKAVRNPVLFNGMQIYQQNLTIKVDEADDHSFSESVFKEINQTILSESLHHKPRLSLSDLAEIMGLNIRDISRAINITTRKNFNDYINLLRISEVKDQIAQNPEKNLLDIGLAAGFGSKSTFNAVFKRETGMTPSGYLRSLGG